jgi:hypothetical protein
MKMSVGIIVTLLALVVVPFSYAYNILPDQYIYQPDPNITVSDLSARAVFEVSDDLDYDVKITLYNETGDLSPDDFPAVVLLTGLGFVLPEGIAITGGAIGTDYYIGSSIYSDGGQYWTYTNDVTSSFFSDDAVLPTDNVVSTLEALHGVPFSLPGGVIDGPKHGVLSEDESAPTNYPYFDYFVEIYLTLSGSPTIDDTFFAAIDDGNVVASFGSPTMVPEPMTLLLFGMALLGLAHFGRRFRKE